MYSTCGTACVRAIVIDVLRMVCMCMCLYVYAFVYVRVCMYVYVCVSFPFPVPSLCCFALFAVVAAPAVNPPARPRACRGGTEVGREWALGVFRPSLVWFSSLQSLGQLGLLLSLGWAARKGGWPQTWTGFAVSRRTRRAGAGNWEVAGGGGGESCSMRKKAKTG